MKDLDIKKEIETHSVISFDIFDTLLLRPYMVSGDLFKHIEQLKNSHGFAKARIYAEMQARQKHFEKEDITLDEIYQEIAPKFKNLQQAELKQEALVLSPNPRIKEIFEYAKSLKKKIIVVSDIYLTKTFLSRVLKSKGYTGISKIYVSSDEGLSKHTGHLFEIVKKDLNMQGSDILHIGDNPHSDGKMAELAGINNLVLSSPKDLFFKKDKRAAIFYKQNRDNLNLSIMLAIVSYIYAMDEINYWKIFGYKYGGPAILAYMKWLKKELTADKIKDVLFVARDGYTLQKVFDLIDKSKDFTTSYVYISRIFDILFYLNYKQRMEIDPNMEGISSIKKIIETYRHENPILEDQTPDNIKDCKIGDTFIQKHYSIYQELAKKKKSSYEQYINKFILHQKVAVVDTASIYLSSQKFLSKIMSKHGIQVYGYYWLNPTKKTLGNKAYHFKTFQKSHNWEFSNWGMMEFLITAPEPPINDFKDGTPIHKEISPMEAQRIKLYPDISEGEILFAKTMTMFFPDLSFELTAKDVTLWINNFCDTPTEEDASMLSSIQTGIDSNHSEYIQLFETWFNKKEEKKAIKFLHFKIGYIKKKKGKITYKILGIPVWKIKEKN